MNNIPMYSSSAEVNTNLLKPRVERKDLGQQFLAPEVDEPIACSSVPTLVNDFYCNQPLLPIDRPFVTTEGFITLILMNDIRIDISANHSICVSTPNSKIAINNLGQSIGLIHPFGRIYNEFVPNSSSNSCHIESGAHLAKIYSRGIAFTSLNRSLIYLVDTSGCKTTTERFRKLNYDFTGDIFHSNSLTGDYALQRSFADLSNYDVCEDGNDKIWYLAGLRIRENLISGDVMISKSYGKIVINIDSTKSQLKVKAPNLRITASNSAEPFLQVIKPHMRDEQRVVANVDQFRVKYGSQKAGFDANDQLVLM